MSLRATPKFLVGVCSVQLLILAASVLHQASHTECSIAVPQVGPVVVECETCQRKGLTIRSFVLATIGTAVIVCGILAVYLREGRLLYIYGTTMLFFSLIVGLTALLTSLEAPVLEVAVASVSTIDEGCVELAEEMLANARDHATLASLACTIDALGAVLAIRSKELFSYEEIASQHAEVRQAQTL